MTREEVIKLYEKERQYQEKIFGDYKYNKALNLSSFLLFLDNYLNKAKKYYASVWTSKLPPWLNSSSESIDQETCPVQTYEELIKIMALAGSALESYVSINVDAWRDEGVKPKWME